MFKMFSTASITGSPNEKFSELERQLRAFVCQHNVIIKHLSQSSGNSGRDFTTTVTLAYQPRSTIGQGCKPGGVRVRVLWGTRSEVEKTLASIELPELYHMAQSEYYNEPESYMVMTVID
ncbi:MAG: hypothetical protein WCW31_03330 [Patescibacteria group bacterium]|jgi:hypothetical protein